MRINYILLVLLTSKSLYFLLNFRNGIFEIKYQFFEIKFKFNTIADNKNYILFTIQRCGYQLKHYSIFL